MNERPAAGGGSTNRHLIIIAFGAAVFAGAVSMRILDALLPDISDNFDVTIGAAGLSVTAYAASYSVCQIFYGPLGDRIGPYPVVTSAALCSAMAAVGCAMAVSFDWFLALRFIGGAVAAAIGPLALAWVSHATTAEMRPLVVANITSASIIGATVGQVGGGVIAHAFGWQASFLFVATMFGVAGLALYWVGLGRADLRALGKQPQSDTSSSQASLRLLVKRRQVRITLLAVGLEGFATYMSFTYTAALISARLEVTAATAGLLISSFGAGGLTFLLLARALIPRTGNGQRAVLGALLMGAGFLLLSFAHTFLLVGTALFVLGVGFFMFHNILQVMATHMAPDAVGGAISLFAGTFFSSQAAGALVGGWTYDHLGGAISCQISAAILLILGLMMKRELDAGAAPP